MDGIKHSGRFAEMERLVNDYFNCHIAPIMSKTRTDLIRNQGEEMKEYSTSLGGILSMMASSAQPMSDPYQALKVTGEWNSKTTEDYIEMCKTEITGSEEMQQDLAYMAGQWRDTVVQEIGRARYNELSELLGCDLAYAYMDHRIEELMIDRLVKERMPKSSAEYIMRKAAQNTLFGLSYTLNQSPLAAEIERRGEAAYKPSKLEKGTGKVIGASIDAISLGGAGSWASFAKFVGADLAFSALTSSKDKTGNTASVEECISKGVFGSERNVFDRFRKEANEIRANDNPYIIATNERLTKKIPVQSFDFRDWMIHNAQAKMPFDFIAGQKIKDERYKDIPMVIAPEYMETYLQDMEKKEEVKGQSALANNPGQSGNTHTAQSVQQANETETAEESREDTAIESGQQTANANENGWGDFFSTLGLSGMGDISKNLGYVLAMLPDILVGMFTGRTKSLDLGDNVLPIASIVAGIFIKNPILKMMMIGLGGANLLNKAGHEALGWERNEDNGLNTGKRSVRYRVYADEPLNPRISGPILQGNNLIATIDHVPCTIQLPEKVVSAYNAGALPLNTLANAILAKSDRTQQLMSQNYEENDRETIVRTRGIQ